MRIGWSIPLPGPFWIGGTLWQSKRRTRYYNGTLPDGWRCRHHHQREDTALACANQEAKRRGLQLNRPNPQKQVQRGRFFHATLSDGWECEHDHKTREEAIACSVSEQKLVEERRRYYEYE
jgi:hypothetical protein